VKPKMMWMQLEDETDLKCEIERRQNEFLDLYSFYRETYIVTVKEELLRKAYELHVLNPKFTFHI
jgi:hypothetical protein